MTASTLPILYRFDSDVEALDNDLTEQPSLRTAMEHYAGIDVSLELSSVCVMDAQGKIVREAKVASEPEALLAFFASLSFAVKRIGLEAGPLSQWLHAGLKRTGFDAVLLETRRAEKPQSVSRRRPAIVAFRAKRT